jgi:O-antigen/teichoic acid export membrane protein
MYLGIVQPTKKTVPENNMTMLRRNVIANYISQIYAVLAGILSVPIYAQYLGMEAFGVIGFYVTLQAWFQVLDVGLSSTLSRESSLYNADRSRQVIFGQVKSLLEKFFYGAAICSVLIFYISSEWMSINWLKANQIEPATIALVLQLIGVIIAFRWLSCLYRGMVVGFELQVWLAKLNIVVNTARFLIPLPVIIYFDAGLTFYFYMQLAVAVAEFFLLHSKMRLQLKSMRAIQCGPEDKVDRSEFQRILNFAYGVATTSVIWVIVTQTDKLVLSKVLPLDEYGGFSLAITLANGIILISGPISMAILPRMTNIATRRDKDGLILMYRRLTQLVVTVLTPVTLVLTVTAYSAMYAWTGNAGLSKNAELILTIYAVGNLLMSIGASAYALQYSLGLIRMHVIGNMISAIIYVPCAILAAMKYGAIGAATSWLFINLIYLLLWISHIHKKLVPGINHLWFTVDTSLIILAGSTPVIFFLLIPIDFYQLSRSESLMALVLVGLVSSAFSIVASGASRNLVKSAGIRVIRAFNGHSH